MLRGKGRLRRKPIQGVGKDEEAYENREKEEPGKRLLPHELEGSIRAYPENIMCRG